MSGKTHILLSKTSFGIIVFCFKCKTKIVFVILIMPIPNTFNTFIVCLKPNNYEVGNFTKCNQSPNYADQRLSHAISYNWNKPFIITLRMFNLNSSQQDNPPEL